MNSKKLFIVIAALCLCLGQSLAHAQASIQQLAQIAIASLPKDMTAGKGSIVGFTSPRGRVSPATAGELAAMLEMLAKSKKAILVLIEDQESANQVLESALNQLSDNQLNGFTIAFVGRKDNVDALKALAAKKGGQLFFSSID